MLWLLNGVPRTIKKLFGKVRNDSEGTKDVGEEFVVAVAGGGVVSAAAFASFVLFFLLFFPRSEYFVKNHATLEVLVLIAVDLVNLVIGVLIAAVIVDSKVVSEGGL